MGLLNSVRIRSYWNVLFGLLLLPLIAGQISFTSTYNGKTVTGLVGSSVNFTWSFTGDVKRVYWGLKKYVVNDFESNGILISLDRSGPVSVSVPSAYIGRVSGRGDVSSGQVIFTLSSISRSDERFYGCKIRPTNIFDSIIFDSVHLVVKEAPQINISSVEANYTEGSLVSISCTASGTPDPDVKWIRNGIVKSSGRNVSFLTFFSVNRADAGQYTCRANNSAGIGENHVALVVYYPPTIQQASTSAAKSWIGQTVTLKCVSDGVPTPTLTWYKPDGNELKTAIATENTMNVRMENDGDFGEYKCVAVNVLTVADYRAVKVQQIRGDNPCFNNSCYVISDAESGKTWPENRRTCQAKGGDLVSIETEGEWQFINEEIHKHFIEEPNEWHIGLKINDQGDWKWVNGKPLTISKWQTTMGQPSGDGDVVVMSKDYPPTTQGLFNDLDEGLPRAFICEIKAT